MEEFNTQGKQTSFYKYCPGTFGYTLVYMLILKIWEKEELPADWENSIICPIYKKGD